MAGYLASGYQRDNKDVHSEWPETTPADVPPNPETRGPFHRRRTHAAQALVGMLVKKFGRPAEKEPETFGEAYEALERLGRRLFR